MRFVFILGFTLMSSKMLGWLARSWLMHEYLSAHEFFFYFYMCALFYIVQLSSFFTFLGFRI